MCLAESAEGQREGCAEGAEVYSREGKPDKDPIAEAAYNQCIKITIMNHEGILQ